MCDAVIKGPYETALELAIEGGWDMDVFDRSVDSLGAEVVLVHILSGTYIDPSEL